MKRLAFLAPSRSGWGEITLALRIAHRAKAAGMDCRFLTDPSIAGLVGQQGFETRPVPDARGPAFLDALRKELVGFDGVVLVDLYLGGSGLLTHGVHPRSALDLGPRLIGIDTWSFDQLGGWIDVTDTYGHPIEPTWFELDRRIVPVPFAPPGAPFATRLLPMVHGEVPRPETIRAELGLSGPVVLLCTSWWQHAMFDAEGCARIEELLGIYLARLDPDVTVAHVGPAPLDLGPVRYRKLDSMPAHRFHGLLAACDLVLSTNTSATTNTAAIAAGVPVLAVVNRSTAARVSHLAFQLGRAPGPEVAAWLRSRLPMPRFFMWPMSMMQVLPRLLADNPYADLLHMTEILDEQTFHERATDLLFDQSVRSDVRQRGEAYLASLSALPDPVDRLRAYLDD